VSITPLELDLTDHERLAQAKEQHPIEHDGKR
jgi:hypothetical protein